MFLAFLAGFLYYRPYQNGDPASEHDIVHNPSIRIVDLIDELRI